MTEFIPALLDFILYCIINVVNDYTLYGHGRGKVIYDLVGAGTQVLEVVNGLEVAVLFKQLNDVCLHTVQYLINRVIKRAVTATTKKLTGK